jgi:uncharacterized protein YndB with AHSA1/START domain
MSSHARSIKHSSFAIERVFNHEPAALYRAWTDPSTKARWFNGPVDKWTEVERTMDVRIGGRDRLVGKFVDGSESRFESEYFDVVPGRRLVYAYDMYWQGKKLIVTEQHAFLDGYEDVGSRERGTKSLFDNIAVALAGGDTRKAASS